MNQFHTKYRGFTAVLILSGISFTGIPSLADSGEPLFKQQWALDNTGQNICDMRGHCQKGTVGKDIKALRAWETSRDCRGAAIAVLDSGADYTHPELKGNILPGKNFTVDLPTDDATDDHFHGTHVVGTIAAMGTQTQGVSGICGEARVLVVKVADANGNLADSDIIQGINYAAEQGARIVNASFGGGGESKAMSEAIAKASNTLFVIAAGNGNPFTQIGFDIDADPVYPASYPLRNILVVAATDNQDKLGSFSNFGAKTVGIAAPGVGILSTTPMVQTKIMKKYKLAAKHAISDGTSMAAPHIAGAAALLLGHEPKLTAAELKERLLQGVEPVPALQKKVSSGGRLNLAKLMGQDIE